MISYMPKMHHATGKAGSSHLLPSEVASERIGNSNTRSTAFEKHCCQPADTLERYRGVGERGNLWR